jgi:hypothetical protein
VDPFRVAVLVETGVSRVEERLLLEDSQFTQPVEIVGNRRAGVDTCLGVAVIDKKNTIRVWNPEGRSST